jgi:hypothetical protein
MIVTRSSPSPAASPLDRRRQPRIEILGRLAGEILPTAAPVEVRDVGLGGFSIVTSSPLEPGSFHDFRLTPSEWSSVELRARVVHCRPESPGRYVSGLEFVARADEPSPATELIDRLTSDLTFGD